MPRIPMSDRGYVPHVEGGVRMTGAPGMGFGMENARGLRDVANGLDGLGEGAMKVYGALKMRAEAAQEAEDTDNMQALELNEMQMTNELNAFMRENPGRYLDFENELQTRTKNLMEARTGYLEKMSPNARRRAEFYLKKTDLDRANNVRYVGWQAQATAKMQNLETRLSDLAKIGADDVAIQMIDEYTVGDAPLLTQPMADQFKAKYWEQRDFFQARELIDAGDPDVLEKLNKKSDGQFTEYTHLTREQRDQLKRYGQQKTIERENEADDNVLASFNSGTPIYATKTQLDEALEKKQITKKQYNKYSNWLESWNADIENSSTRARNKRMKAEVEGYRANLTSGNDVPYKTVSELNDAYQRGVIDAEQYNDYYQVLSSYENSLASAQRQRETDVKQMQAKLASDAKEGIMFDVYRTVFSSDPTVAINQAQQCREIADAQITDLGNLKQIHEFIDQRMNDAINGKNEFATTNGKVVFDYINKEYRDGEKFEDLYYDPNGLFNKVSDQNFQRARFYEVMDQAREYLRAGDQSQDVIKKIKEQVAELNDGKIAAIMDRSTMSKVSVRKYYPGFKQDGYTFKGGDPTVSANWEKDK